jgi:N-acetylglucosamine-6-phosphate deacetylase
MPEPVRSLHGRVLTDGQELPDTRVEIAEGRIVAVRPGVPATDADLVVTDGWIIPGLVELQVNGAGGVDLTSAEPAEEALAAVALVLAAHGVTAFCPTIVSTPAETIVERITAYRPRAIPGGAACLGAHVEGPFISPAHRGVHDPAMLRPPSSAEIERWLAAGRRPAIVTLAPELPGAIDAIRQLVRAGARVSLGHSGADLSSAGAGLAAGARLGTHLFNAMPPLHHRRPGLVGALLGSTATLGLIGDGFHVDPLMVELVVRLAGPERVALVSDALAPAGGPPGPAALGDQVLDFDGRVLRRADGVIGGAAVLLDTCLRNVRQWLPSLPPAEVVRMATQTPAEALGGEIAACKGRIAPGYDADLVVLDRSWHVARTMVCGEPVPAASPSPDEVIP